MQNLLEQQQLLSGRMPATLRYLYLLLIVLVILCIIATWFVHMDVVVISSGIIRPAQERTSVRASVGGIIDSIWITEGQCVKKGERIAVLKDEQNFLIHSKVLAEVRRKQAILQDIYILTAMRSPGDIQAGMLKTELYQEQYAQFTQQLDERNILLSHVEKELEVADKLVKEHIISQAEYDTRKSLYQQRTANRNIAWHEQLAIWNTERQRLTDELDQLDQQLATLAAENKKMQLVAPVSGIVMGLREHYSQGLLQSGEVLCSISPEDSLVVECFVSQDNIGFLRPGQIVSLKVDAFDHKQFGVVQGMIHSIDDDFTIINQSPVFKIRCSIKQRSVSLKNGYSANLKKGMTLQARFMITKRTIWQLFFDRLHNWLEPVVTV